MNAMAMIEACMRFQTLEPDHRCVVNRGQEMSDTPFFAHATDTGIVGVQPIPYEEPIS